MKISLKNMVLYSSFVFFSSETYSNEISFKQIGYKQDSLLGSAPISEKVFYPSGHLHKTYWPNGEVFYRLEPGHFNANEISVIIESMKIIEKNAKIKFIEQNDTKEYYVKIMKFDPSTGRDYGCESHVGKSYYVQFDSDYRQRLSLGSQCIYRKEYRGYQLYDVPNHSTILHELMHTLGIDHEQTRFDRDDYVVYLNENYNFTSINHGKMENNHNYEKSENSFNSSVTGYDYSSIMQYHPYSGSKNGLPVIIPKKCKPLYDQNPYLFDQRNLNLLQGCDELKVMASYSKNLSKQDICTLQFMYGEPEGVLNPVDCRDVLRKKQNDNTSNYIKKREINEKNNKNNKTSLLYSEDDDNLIAQCKNNNKYSSQWKTYNKNNTLKYYRYFSEKNGNCKQEVHIYYFDTKNNSWSKNVEKYFVDIQ